MKKTYISPEFLLVELRGSQMLAQSIEIGGGTTGEDDGGWVKAEDNGSITDTKLWDNEW